MSRITESVTPTMNSDSVGPADVQCRKCIQTDSELI
jgi:hypothetical protein